MGAQSPDTVDVGRTRPSSSRPSWARLERGMQGRWLANLPRSGRCCGNAVGNGGEAEGGNDEDFGIPAPPLEPPFRNGFLRPLSDENITNK